MVFSFADFILILSVLILGSISYLLRLSVWLGILSFNWHFVSRLFILSLFRTYGLISLLFSIIHSLFLPDLLAQFTYFSCLLSHLGRLPDSLVICFYLLFFGLLFSLPDSLFILPLFFSPDSSDSFILFTASGSMDHCLFLHWLHLLPALPFSGLRPSLKGEECNQPLISGSLTSRWHALNVLSAIAIPFVTSLFIIVCNLWLLLIRLILLRLQLRLLFLIS